MEHTKEPWPAFTDIAVMMTPDPEGTPVAVLSWDDYIRARACVNACAGLPLERLEAVPAIHSAREFIDVILQWKDQRDHLESENAKQAELLNKVIEQRDDLLAALKDAVEHIKAVSGKDLSCDPSEDVSDYEAAIAKVKPYQGLPTTGTT